MPMRVPAEVEGINYQMCYGLTRISASHSKTMSMKKNLNLYVLKAYNASARFTHDKIFLTISLFSLLFILISAAASAQTQTITGIVRDDAQQALAGASIMIKGTDQGVLADENGRFSIPVDPGKHDVLVFSFLAKKSAEISLAEKGTRIDLTLFDDPSFFTELVVTGEATTDHLYTEKKSGKNSHKKLKRLFEPK
jgi:hypothetical protein